jgi:hypothetical protein
MSNNPVSFVGGNAAAKWGKEVKAMLAAMESAGDNGLKPDFLVKIAIPKFL